MNKIKKLLFPLSRSCPYYWHILYFSWLGSSELCWIFRNIILYFSSLSNSKGEKVGYIQRRGGSHFYSRLASRYFMTLNIILHHIGRLTCLKCWICLIEQLSDLKSMSKLLADLNSSMLLCDSYSWVDLLVEWPKKASSNSRGKN